MLRVEQLESGYGESRVLRGVDLEVRPGQVVCLIGRNGVGKSTLIKSIMGVLRARRGMISWGGRDLARKAPGLRARSGIGYVPQGREIFPQLTVRDNILLGLEAARGWSRGAEREIPEQAIARFPVLPSMYERRGGDLSGGQQQQLAFARALASEPELLLLDEPCEGIQPSIVDDIREVIRSVKADGTTAILLVEQSLEFVRSVGDYVYILERGAVAWKGSPAELDDAVVRRHLTV